MQEDNLISKRYFMIGCLCIVYYSFHHLCVARQGQSAQPGPSGMSRSEAFSMPENWGGRDGLLPVDVNVVRELKEVMGGDDILEFVSEEFSERAQYMKFRT